MKETIEKKTITLETIVVTHSSRHFLVRLRCRLFIFYFPGSALSQKFISLSFLLKKFRRKREAEWLKALHSRSKHPDFYSQTRWYVVSLKKAFHFTIHPSVLLGIRYSKLCGSGVLFCSGFVVSLRH